MNTYIDKTTKAQHVYVYKVIGLNDCEGLHTDSVTVEGWCEPTGMVRGYVRLPDGTAIANVTVVANPQDTKNGITKSTVTSENGFFEIGGLTYVGAGSYEIVASSAGNESPYSKFIANFDEDKNLVTNAVLIQNTYYLFQGYVMYEGTSVPVIGAQFERDGMVVKNGSGAPVITDSQGRFSVSIPQGDHTIRVVKDGHVFMDEGFYLDENNNRNANWQKGVAEYVFWDQTTVTLQGRVVGGDVEGMKPLGELASINNLGDSLTIVMQLEGDNASYLVRDQLNASITERHDDYYFALLEKDTCHMDVYRHRLVIKPSHVTGEYCVPMLPVKYKVTEIYGDGYPTLFQAGKVGETLDLSDYVNKDTVTYSRIYHAQPTLNVTQFNMLGEPYMGIKSYTDKDNTGKEVFIELWNADKGYSFGYPVYMAGSHIIMQLAAVEKYYKNNDSQQGAPDIVQLTGGEVSIHNALVGSNGDIIKSQSEFTVLSVDAFGNKQWKGTLKYLRVGEGYMLKRNADSEVTFNYPIYTSNTRYGGESYTKRAEPAFQNNSGTSMTVVAMAEGVDVELGDRLTVYQGAELCGVAVADEQGVFYLNVGAHEPNGAEDNIGTNESLSFMLERGEEVVAVTTRSQMRFVPNASHGTPDEPTAINFTNADAFDSDGWYTLNGIKLSHQPQQRGVYIHNNEKVIIK